jgi:hypothetical protein
MFHGLPLLRLFGLYILGTRRRLHGGEQPVSQKLRIGFFIQKFPPSEHRDQILLG